MEKKLSRSRRTRIRWLYGVAAVASIAMFIVFWFTNVFRDAILSNLELRNGTPAFLLWQRPPIELSLKVYVLNYTNLDEFEDGKASKLRVQEVGPYVYRETLSRVNAELHDNETITYQEKRSFRWIGGRPDTDKVVVPNVLLMSTFAFFRNMPYAVQLIFNTILSTLRTKPFLRLSVSEFLWGYEDKLFETIKPFASLMHHMPYEKFGILAFINGVSVDRITVHTGVGDLHNLGMIQRVNGRENRNIWGNEKCDKVFGTDGSMFPPQWIEQPNGTLYVYAKDVCRSMPFQFERRGFAHGVPTLRYKLPSNVFTSTPKKDSCFCSKESNDSNYRRCPPAGTFNVSACKFGTPLLLSLPHFYGGDASLFQRIEGLRPNRERHESYLDLHPRLGVTMAASMKFQMNLEVRKATGLPFADKLEDGTILPLLWMSVSVDEDIPESLREVFYRGHYLANAIEAVLQWCSLIAAVLSFVALVAAFKQNERTDTVALTLTIQTELARS